MESKSEPKSIKFNAYIESVEETEETFELILDGIEADRFNELNEANFSDLINSVSVNIFSLSLKKEAYNRLNRLEESNWVSFNLFNSAANTQGDVYQIALYNSVSFDEEPKLSYIDDILPIDIEAKTKIFSMKIFKESNINDIKNLIMKKIPKYIDSVLVYNVGQGNCNAITNHYCFPIIFYDFGGGAYQNTKTYPGNDLNPKKLRLNLSKEPLVILSHWDWDHMVSITKDEHKDIKKSYWIVPKQNIGISHLKVALELYNNDKLLVWPDNENELKTMDLKIQKLNGTNKNNSGLVLTTYLYKDIANAVLLPADANYELIKRQNTNYIGLVATHHGASSHNCLLNMPNPSRNTNKIAFSFGKNNTYNHPKRDSLYEHALKGWSNTYYTVNGHIHFGHYHYNQHCNYIPTIAIY